MNAFFIVLLVVLVVLAILFAVGAAYVTRFEDREREEFANQARSRSMERARRGGDGREFYKSLGLGTGEQVKIRLFTLQEYRDELGGEAGVGGDEGFIGALKAYRQLDEEWYETPPEKAVGPLDLREGEYRLDEERHALLLKKLPPGVPPSARDMFE